ncbi:MAG: cation:proton antiporter [Nakamurella sp.]
MNTTLQILLMVAIIVAVAAGARRGRYSEPLVLVAVGVALSFVPNAFDIHITPELVLGGLLPPLLYAMAIRTPLVQFARHRRAIVLLAIGAVVFSTFAVGLAVWWMLPGVAFAAACAFGAVVAPPDAVAATAVARRIGMPRRIVAILEGESLLNDATALVALSTAITAMSVSVTPGQVLWDFLLAAAGGVAVGIAAAIILATVRKHLTTPVLDTALSFAAPYVAFLPAQEIGVSGVLAVVVTGLWLGHRSISLQSASSRITESINWNTVQFLLENGVFLLIGLQLRDMLVTVDRGALAWRVVIPLCVVTLLVTIASRVVYVFASTAATHVARRKRWPWSDAAVISWAGMRGVVTLAAVFVIPASTPNRAVLALAAFTVVVGTLLIQGLTLPRLVRRLSLHGPDPVEDALQLAGLTGAAVKAGLSRLAEEAGPDDPADVIQQLRDRAALRVNLTWERLGRPRSELEPPSAVYRRLRTAMLAAERNWIIDSRHQGHYDEEVLRRALSIVDLEESMLDERGEAMSRLAEQLDDQHDAGACAHLRAAPRVTAPQTPNGCAECLRDGTPWVHLRLCLACGHVGCCDSSQGRHATAHYHESGHSVLRSFEPGETWRWCFEDNMIG